MEITPTLNGTEAPRNRHLPHFATIPNEAISILTPYSGLILTICLVVLFFVKQYLLEPIIFPRFYSKVYGNMDDSTKRGFLNHHIAGGIKVVIMFAGAKPFFDVVFGDSLLSSPMTKLHPHPTMGDMLLVLCHLFCAMYLFELFYRRSVSPIAMLHHVGAVMIGQSAMVLSLDLPNEPNAAIEFVLCTVWGMFDVLSEGWLNLAFILYRLRPNNHRFLKKLFAGACAISIIGTTAETVMVMVLFGQSWEVWAIEFKILTPILHIVFTLAQLHGARILFGMWKKQKRILAEEEKSLSDLERSSQNSLERPKRADKGWFTSRREHLNRGPAPS